MKFIIYIYNWEELVCLSSIDDKIDAELPNLQCILTGSVT